jgi:molecular chaperone DnaK
MRVDEGKFETLAAAGDNRLGGEDFDSCLLTVVLAKVDAAKAGTRAGASVGASAGDWLRDPALRAGCARARVALSAADNAAVTLAPGLADAGAAEVTVSRAEFEAALAPLVARAAALVAQVLRAAHDRGADANVDEVNAAACMHVPQLVPVVRC